MPGFDGKGALPEPGEIPDVLGTVRGYRWWTLPAPPLWDNPARSGPSWQPGLLRGMQAFWEPGENTAACRAGTASNHPDADIPVESCGCGFWAYWKPQPHDLSRSALPVFGVVEGYGAVLLGTKGFRAARARIVALHLPFTIMPEDYARAEVARAAIGDGGGYPRQYGSHNPWWNHPKFTGKVVHVPGGPPPPTEDTGLNLPPAPEPSPEMQQALADAAEAWMAVIGDRLATTYPDATVYETLNALQKEYPPDLSYVSG
jgi:hypothetical protein